MKTTLMKAFIIFFFVTLVAGIFCPSIFSAEPPPVAVITTGPATAPSSGDPDSDLVASFYRALLQEDPPTREQEKALFNEPCIVRTRLVLGRRDEPDDEPMLRTPKYFERCRQDEAKAAAAGPVVLTYLRNHKDWFLPIGTKDSRVVCITSLVHYVRGIYEVKDPLKEGTGYVLAIVPDIANGRRVIRTRVVIFPIVKGKIDLAWVHLNGHDSPMIMEEVQKEP